MNKLRYFVSGLCVLNVWSVIAAVTINLDGGVLYGDNTSSPLADGRLVYAVASASNTFSGPVGGSFTSGDEVILGSWGIDSVGTGVAGAFSTALVFDLSASVVAGKQIAIYWFSDLSVGSLSPSMGDKYGFYSDPSWLIPADGNTLGYSVETIAIGGSVSNSSTVANLVVSAVPEPATFGLVFGSAALGMVACRRRKRV